ncbi:Bcl-2-like protein 13 [Sarotherodon galilaeus]
MEAVLGLMVILLGVSHVCNPTKKFCEKKMFYCSSTSFIWKCPGDEGCPNLSTPSNAADKCCKSGNPAPGRKEEEYKHPIIQIMFVCFFAFVYLFKFAGLETCCDIKQHGAQCYGSLGGNVDIQLMDNTSKTSKYQLMKNSLKILNVRNNKVLPNAEGQRFVFFPSNGTFRIPNMSRNDSGNYTLQTFDSDGRASGEWTLQLFIQAPVSSVLLVSECLSQREMRVSCSSEGGDSPQYSWTLDGRTLTDAELLPGNNETNIITLKQHVSGHLVCSVRNNVSNVIKEERISTCKAGILQVIGGILLALVILLVVGIAIIFNQRKKQNYKPTKEKDEEDDQVELRAAVNLEAEVELEFEVEFESEDEDEGEGEGEAEAEKKVEVEYAQVKFPKQPRHTQPTGNNYLYATVRKMR